LRANTRRGRQATDRLALPGPSSSGPSGIDGPDLNLACEVDSPGPSRHPVHNSDALRARATIRIRHQLRGPVAQLGARLNGIQEVTGSIPVRSTTFVFEGFSGCNQLKAGAVTV